MKVLTFIFLSSLVNIKAYSNDMLKAADVKSGKEIAGICFVCHSIVKNEPSKGSSPSRVFVGPNLFGVYGRKIASRQDFKYSPALSLKKNEVWSAENLSSFLKNPSRFAPGTIMSYGGVLDPQDRMDLIAYLKTLK